MAIIKIKLISFLVVITFIASSCAQKNYDLNTDEHVAFVGCYTNPENLENEGIYSITQNKNTGEIVKGDVLTSIKNPSFLKVSPDRNTLYAVSELSGEGVETGFLYAYSIGKENSLSFINKLPTNGTAPCHIAISNSGSFVFVANYSGGVVMVYETLKNGGLKEFQKLVLDNPAKSHAHSVTLSADNKQIYIADLGNDKIWMYTFNEKEKSIQKAKIPFVKLEEGSGPRHFVISKDSGHAYVVNELNSTITVFDIDKNGVLIPLQQISSLPKSFEKFNSGADIHITNSGEFLYVSNRGHNSIASFKIDNNSGRLTALGYTSTKGETPRNFAISSNDDYLYVANQNSGNIVSYRIDAENGSLTPFQNINANTPVCIEFLE